MELKLIIKRKKKFKKRLKIPWNRSFWKWVRQTLGFLLIEPRQWDHVVQEAFPSPIVWQIKTEKEKQPKVPAGRLSSASQTIHSPLSLLQINPGRKKALGSVTSARHTQCKGREGKIKLNFEIKKFKPEVIAQRPQVLCNPQKFKIRQDTNPPALQSDIKVTPSVSPPPCLGFKPL